jgi:exodeoxyribonuclease V gamma subunit
VSSPLEAEETHDAIPITLDGLEKWQIGDRLVADVLGGVTPGDSVRAQRLRGVLPPGRLGAQVLAEVEGHAKPLVLHTLQLRQGRPRTVDVDIDLGGGRRLTGTIGSVFGNRLVTASYSSLAAKHRLRSWLDLLALTVGRPDESWVAHALGRGKAATAQATAGPLDERAEAWLRALVDLYDRGMREPLPLPVKTACAYAEETARRLRSGSGSPEWKARREWETDRYSATGIPGEDADPPHVQVYGEDAPVGLLLTPPRADEQWNAERHRLGRLAVHLWEPLLDGAERVGHL